MREAIMLAIAVFIGEIIGYFAGKQTANKLDQAHLLELEKFKAERFMEYVENYKEGDD